MGIDFVEAVQYFLNALNGAVLDIVNQALFFAGRQQQTRKVVPIALADGRCWFAQPSALDGSLQHSTHIDAQGNVVILDALLQRRSIDDILLEVIAGHIVATCLTQILQNLLTLNNLAYGEWAEPVKVDDALTARSRTLVALRPLLDVTIQPHSGDVTTWYDIHSLAVCQQIGERQTAHVGMVHQLAEADGESTNLGRHQHVGARGCLGATLQGAIMQWTHLIGVVGEIGV